MERQAAGDASELRRELGERSRTWAQGRAHVESYGQPGVIVFAPEDGRHGNFLEESYVAIAAQPEWFRRFDKIHSHGRALPRPTLCGSDGQPRKWRELDSSMSSDALLMNIFCAPGVAQLAGVRGGLAVDVGWGGQDLPIFGWKARVPLANGRVDRTEVDMRWGNLLVESKLTEADFQTRAAKVVEGYRDFDVVFDRDRLPRAEIRTARRRAAVEFAEEFTQEWEEPAADDSIAQGFQAGLVAQARQAEPAEPGYRGYQLIRNVLAAYATGASFCVLHDARRPDLREQWYDVMAAVKVAEMRVRCKVLTWQELAGLVPAGVEEFLRDKYGISAAE